MLKNFPSSILFTPYKSSKNLNDYLPNKSCIKLKKNYKFNELNPIHSERKSNNFNKTRNYQTPNRQNKSKIINLNSVNIPKKKNESFFSSEINNNNMNNNYSLLNSIRYISSPLLNNDNINNNKGANLNLKKTLIFGLLSSF